MADITDRLGLAPWCSHDDVLHALLDHIEALEQGPLLNRAMESPETLALLVDRAKELMGK